MSGDWLSESSRLRRTTIRRGFAKISGESHQSLLPNDRLAGARGRVTVTGAGVGISEVTLFVPHQANQRIIAAVGERLGLAPEKVYVNLEKVGNTSAASIPLALRDAVDEGRLKRGDLVLTAAFGGGLTWAAALLRW